MPEDVADHELPARADRGLHDALCARDRLGEGLFDEHVRATLHRLDGELRMRVRQRVDRDHVRTRLGERLLVVRKAPGASECVRELPVGDVPRTDTHDVEIRDPCVRERVRQAHVPKPNDQYSLLGHVFVPGRPRAGP